MAPTALLESPARPAEPPEDPATERWVMSYRRSDPAADRWALGCGSVRHTLQTQDRVFRMVEQLESGGWGQSGAIFKVLATADRLTGSGTLPAAYAGYSAIKTLTGKPISWQARQDSAQCLTARGEPILLKSIEKVTDEYTWQLGKNGFEPIVFDGRDPAAFAWALFEMDSRLQAHAQTAACGLTPGPRPFGVAEGPALGSWELGRR